MSRWRLPKGEFARHALTLMTGTTIAQAIPIAISPILTRLFTPADYGVFALYAALVALLAVAATGGYELAVMLPEHEEDADALVVLSVLVAIGVSVVLLIMTLVLHDHIVALLGHPEIAGLLYLVPLSVVIVGSYSALNYWLNRRKDYRRMSANRVLQSALGGGLQVAGGTAALGAAGLIGGQLVGQVITTGQLVLRFWRSPRVTTRGALLSRARGLALRYRNHPRHLLPGNFIGTTALQLPMFAVAGLFGATTAGLFALGNRILLLPSQLIANALGDVYRQRAAVAYREHGEFRALFLKTLAYTAVLAVVPVGVIVAIAPDLFALVFGEPWRVAGDYARILAIGAYLQFVFAPVDKGALIVGATRYIFWWHVARLAGFAGAAALTWALRLPVEQFLLLYVVANSAVYVLDGWVEYRLSYPRSVGENDATSKGAGPNAAERPGI